MHKLIIRTVAACGLALSLASAANASCLTAIPNFGIAAAWENHCPWAISVNWTDQGGCAGWACSDIVPPHKVSAVSPWSGQMTWCEERYPRFAHGPC